MDLRKKSTPGRKASKDKIVESYRKSRQRKKCMILKLDSQYKNHLNMSHSLTQNLNRRSLHKDYRQ
jgi:hypothetical protein